MISINYVAGPVGSGKTYSAIQFIVANPNFKYLNCCPSTLLCEQVARDLRTLCPKLRVQTIYHDGHHIEKVPSRITKHLQAADAHGEVLIITHTAFELVKFFQSAGRWEVFWDEAPQVVWYEGIHLAQHSSLVLGMLDTPVNVSPSFSQVEPQHDGGTIDVMMADRTSDRVCQLLQPFAGRLSHAHWKTFVDAEQFEQFSINRSNPGEGDHRLDVFGLLQPTIFSGFRNVTIFAAHFESTLSFLYWSGLGVEFVPHSIIRPRSVKVPRRIKKESLFDELDEVNKWPRGTNETPYIQGPYVSSVFGSVFLDIYSTHFLTAAYGTHLEFVDQLRTLSKDLVQTKDERMLFSPSLFIAHEGVLSRKKENVHSANGIWLDNDAGDLTPENFAAIFPMLKCIYLTRFRVGRKS